MSRFSLIIPLLGSNSQFENTLASALRYRTESCQIIVPHGSDYADPYGLAKEVDFVEFKYETRSKTSPPNLIQLFNSAMHVARGDWVALLRPGVQLEENWDEPVQVMFADPNVGSVAPAIVANSLSDRLVTAGVRAGATFNRRLVGVNQKRNSKRLSKVSPLGPASWAAYYRRSLLTSLGECDPQLDPHYLDLDLALSLRALDFECAFCPESVVTIDEISLIADEARLAHGRSAQRAFARFTELSAGQRLARLCSAAVQETAIAPWRPASLKHALQRIGASRFKASDEHHQELLAILQKQRSRLAMPELRVGQPTGPTQATGTLASARRAA